MTERLTFKSVHQFREHIVRNVDEALRLADLIGSPGSVATPGLSTLVATEIATAMIYVHNLLAEMRDAAPFIINVSYDDDKANPVTIVTSPYDYVPTGVITPDLGRMKKINRATFNTTMAFIRGAVSDPFLYAGSDDPEQDSYQQAAVLGLDKARKAIAGELYVLLKAPK